MFDQQLFFLVVHTLKEFMYSTVLIYIFHYLGEPSLLWVDKYRPRSVKQIIGQQGDKSNMRKLMNWLRDWDKNRKKPATKCK